jgi:hypothetical protein
MMRGAELELSKRDSTLLSSARGAAPAIGIASTSHQPTATHRNTWRSAYRWGWLIYGPGDATETSSACARADCRAVIAFGDHRSLAPAGPCQLLNGSTTTDSAAPRSSTCGYGPPADRLHVRNRPALDYRSDAHQLPRARARAQLADDDQYDRRVGAWMKSPRIVANSSGCSASGAPPTAVFNPDIACAMVPLPVLKHSADPVLRGLSELSSRV